jgi:hypothetical protein
MTDVKWFKKHRLKSKGYTMEIEQKEKEVSFHLGSRVVIVNHMHISYKGEYIFTIACSNLDADGVENAALRHINLRKKLSNV